MEQGNCFLHSGCHLLGGGFSEIKDSFVPLFPYEPPERDQDPEFFLLVSFGPIFCSSLNHCSGPPAVAMTW
jgi:hypothetical protein